MWLFRCMSKVAEPFSIEKLTAANRKTKTNKQEIVNDSQEKKIVKRKRTITKTQIFPKEQSITLLLGTTKDIK